MHKPATRVVSPARPKELPSFEELLADGSFQARLARARAERERALSAMDGDEALFLRRKPWDRAAGAAKPARPVPSAPVAARAEAVPKDVPPEEKRPVLTVVPRTLGDSPVPADGAAPRGRGRMIVVAGFAAGILVGAALASAMLYRSAPRSSVSDIASAAAAFLPATTALPATVPALLANDISAARPPSLPASLRAGPATTAPAPWVEPSTDAAPRGLSGDVAPPRVATEVAAAAPSPPAPARPVAPSQDVIVTHVPLRPHLAPPAGPDTDRPLPEQPLPAAAPSPEAALAAARPEPRPDAPVAAPAHTVLLHAPPSVDDAALSQAVASLQGAGFALDGPRRVDFTISRSNVRYFHAGDAEAAARLAAEIGADLRDFTSYSPTPPDGTIEVWLAGKGSGATAAAPAAKKRAQPSAAERQLRDLSRRILQQLRNGDHL